MKDYATVGSSTDAQLRDINVSIDTNQGLSATEKKARQVAAGAGGSNVLIAWWDGTRKKAGPMEACCGGDPKCAREYAASHSASTRVSVNQGQMEFFYGTIPEGHAELNRDVLLEVHRGLERQDRNDVIGG